MPSDSTKKHFTTNRRKIQPNFFNSTQNKQKLKLVNPQFLKRQNTVKRGHIFQDFTKKHGKNQRFLLDKPLRI